MVTREQRQAVLAMVSIAQQRVTDPDGDMSVEQQNQREFTPQIGASPLRLRGETHKRRTHRPLSPPAALSTALSPRLGRSEVILAVKRAQAITHENHGVSRLVSDVAHPGVHRLPLILDTGISGNESLFHITRSGASAKLPAVDIQMATHLPTAGCSTDMRSSTVAGNHQRWFRKALSRATQRAYHHNSLEKQHKSSSQQSQTSSLPDEDIPQLRTSTPSNANEASGSCGASPSDVAENNGVLAFNDIMNAYRQTQSRQSRDDDRSQTPTREFTRHRMSPVATHARRLLLARNHFGAVAPAVQAKNSPVNVIGTPPPISLQQTTNQTPLARVSAAAVAVSPNTKRSESSTGMPRRPRELKSPGTSLFAIPSSELVMRSTANSALPPPPMSLSNVDDITLASAVGNPSRFVVDLAAILS